MTRHTAAATDWRQILQLYDQLLAVAPSPVVALNRAVALAEVDGPERALEAVDRLALVDYYLYHAIRADLLRRLGRAPRRSRPTTRPCSEPTTSPSASSCAVSATCYPITDCALGSTVVGRRRVRPGPGSARGAGRTPCAAPAWPRPSWCPQAGRCRRSAAGTVRGCPRRAASCRARQGARAASSRRRRVRMTIASELPRCSFVRSKIAPIVSVTA